VTFHAYLSGHNNLFRLLFNGERSDEGSHFLSCLPLGQLTQTFLSSPDRCVNDLEKELASSWVEDEYSSINWLGGQVTFERL